jgi:hypothetical protein
MSRKLKDGSPAGYGRADRKMAEDLSKATSKAQADKVARDRGLKDARDARDWLRDRS